MKQSFDKKALSRLLHSILIIEAKVGEIRFRSKDFNASDIDIDGTAMNKLNESFGVKTPEEFVEFIKSL